MLNQSKTSVNAVRLSESEKKTINDDFSETFRVKLESLRVITLSECDD